MTNERIQLPTILEFCKGGYGFPDCVLTSPPRTTGNNVKPDNNNNDSRVLIVCLYHDEEGDNCDYSFLFCRPGETQWRIHKLSDPYIIDLTILQRQPEAVLCFKGKLYVMCKDHHHVDDNIDYLLEIEYFIKDTDLSISIKLLQVKKVLFPLVGQGKSAWADSHYVESHDEIFMVDLIRSNGSSEVVSIEVVRLNLSLFEWEKVSSFGDHVLFVDDDNHTIGCCSAAELGFTSGCLYYLVGSDLNLIHKFEIESTCHKVNFPCIGPAQTFSCSNWVILHANAQGRVNKLLSEDEENGLFSSLEIRTSTTVAIDENQDGKCKLGGVEVASYWSNLNEDIVLVIANHLEGSDYKHFRLACKANRAIIPKVRTASFVSPWLLFSGDHNDTVFSIVNPVYNDENYAMNLFDLAGSKICFQKDGWLLITRNHNIFFYNPFARETVKLPDMNRPYCYSVISFSSLPISSDCSVFAMDERRDQVYIDFIRRGEAHWSSRIFNNTNVQRYLPFLDTAVFHNGAFFCVDYDRNMGVFSAKDNSWKVLEKPHEILFDHSPSFLVECAGDLLLVKVDLGYPNNTALRIFKLNFSDMEWVKVESLGEHMLFVSYTSCVSAVALNSYMKNKIYFPRLYLNGGGVVSYSLETSSYHSLVNQQSAKDLIDCEGWFSNCTWIIPNMSKSTSQERLDRETFFN